MQIWHKVQCIFFVCRNKEERKRKNMKLRKSEKEKGITLIALLITIIVLVVLAAVVIVNLTGEENIVDKGLAGVEAYDISQYEETIRLAETEARLDRMENKKIIFLDRVQEILEADPNFKEAVMKRIIYEGKDSLIIFVQNHAFVVNDDGVKYLGTSKDFNVPSAEGHLTVTKTPDTEWTTSVILTAEASEKSYEIQYRIGSQGNWEKYEETGLEITENTKVYFRLNLANVYGEAIEIDISNIDEIDPSRRNRRDANNSICK